MNHILAPRELGMKRPDDVFRSDMTKTDVGGRRARTRT
jgi:hypothetical protein